MAFQKAQKSQSKLRMALYGPSGSGKTFTALAIAVELLRLMKLPGRIAVVDSERGSASKYADKFDFDVNELDSYAPETYRKAIRDAKDAGYSILVIDSLSHAWVGAGGVLDIVDDASVKLRGNSHAAWKEGTPEYRNLVDAVLQSDMHVIVTMRSKTEWDMNAKGDNGKKTPTKIGTAPVMRDGIEYEFDVTGALDVEHNLVIDKSRCEALDGKVFKKPSEEPSKTLAAWLSSGSVAAPKPTAEPVKPEARETTPGPTPAEQELAASLSSAATIDELVARWKTTTKAMDRFKPWQPVLDRLTIVKDARKAALSAPPAPVAPVVVEKPVTPPPAAPAPAAATKEEGEDF